VSGNWSLISNKGQGLRMFEKRVLRRIFRLHEERSFRSLEKID
jgi:hypothetical protein